MLAPFEFNDDVTNRRECAQALLDRYPGYLLDMSEDRDCRERDREARLDLPPTPVIDQVGFQNALFALRDDVSMLIADHDLGRRSKRWEVGDVFSGYVLKQ